MPPAPVAEPLMHCVKDIMTREIVTISPEASIRDATDLLLYRRVSGLPVVDGSGKLVGILTEFALLALAYDSNISEDLVAQHMTSDVLTVNCSDPISKVADIFIVHRVRRLPVTEGGRLVGLVARRDILKALHGTAVPCAAS